MVRVASEGSSASRLFPAGADVIEDVDFCRVLEFGSGYRLLPVVADGGSLSNKPRTEVTLRSAATVRWWSERALV